MKRVRRDRERWQPPNPLPATAVFQCRQCHAVLTPPLALLADAALLGQREGTSLAPPGHYWPVPVGQDFAGSLAVALADLAESATTPTPGDSSGAVGRAGRTAAIGCARAGTRSAPSGRTAFGRRPSTLTHRTCGRQPRTPNKAALQVTGGLSPRNIGASRPGPDA